LDGFAQIFAEKRKFLYFAYAHVSRCNECRVDLSFPRSSSSLINDRPRGARRFVVD